jgi:hypothetical protein
MQFVARFLMLHVNFSINEHEISRFYRYRSLGKPNVLAGAYKTFERRQIQ